MSHKYLPKELDSSAVELVVTAVVSGGVDLCEATDAAYHIEGYVLGKLIPCDHAPKANVCPETMTKEEKAEKLRLLTAKAGATEIPYWAIWLVIRQIIDSLLSK